MINKYIQQLTRAWQGLSKPQLRVKKIDCIKCSALSLVFVLFCFLSLSLSLFLSLESLSVFRERILKKLGQFCFEFSRARRNAFLA